MLENQSDKAKALDHASKAAKLLPDSPEIADTLTRALMENGKPYEAALTVNNIKEN